MSSHRWRTMLAEFGRFVRANLSSTIASGLEYVLVTGLVIAGVHYLVAATAGAVSGAVTDFSLKRHWAFPRAASGRISRQGMRYLGVSGMSLLLNLALSYVFVEGLHAPKVPGVIGASLVVGFAWNYPLHRLYVFRTIQSGPGPAEAQRGEA